MFNDREKSAAGESSRVTEDEYQKHVSMLEMKTKKLMTVTKSKYFMLKANFPKQAEMVDSEPLIVDNSTAADATMSNEEKFSEERQGQFTNDASVAKEKIVSMSQQAQPIEFERDTPEMRKQQLDKDKQR